MGCVLAARTDAAFKAFLDAQNPRQQHSATLESYLIKPIQRVLKYPLLLRELFALTHVDSEEHYHLDGERGPAPAPAPPTAWAPPTAPPTAGPRPLLLPPNALPTAGAPPTADAPPTVPPVASNPANDPTHSP